MTKKMLFEKWEVTGDVSKFKPKPILFVGLPGIGNVGKIAADFLVSRFKATAVVDIFSLSFPHSAFMNQDGTVRRPTMGLYQFTKNRQNFVVMAGDLQPLNTTECYELTKLVFELMGDIQLVTTFGGIGVEDLTDPLRVGFVGTTKDVLTKYKKAYGVNNFTPGSIGPIVGTAGTFLTEAKARGIDATCIATDTYNKPLYLGINGSIQILKVINKAYSLGIDTDKLDDEFSKLRDMAEVTAEPEPEEHKSLAVSKDSSYIG